MADQQVSKTGYQDQLALLTFVDNLIRDRKDPRVNESNIAQVRELLLKEINEAVNTHLITLLNDKDQAELSMQLDNNINDAELNKFFKNKIPNFEVEMATALLNFRAAYIYPDQSSFTKQAAAMAQNAPKTIVREEDNGLGAPLPPAPVA